MRGTAELGCSVLGRCFLKRCAGCVVGDNLPSKMYTSVFSPRKQRIF